MINIFRRPPPPPPKKWYQQPALILTMVAMFVLGPVGVIYNSMSEELKQKVDNKTLQLMITKDREALKRQADELKEKEKKDEQQDAAIIENQKTLILLRQKATITTPKDFKVKDTQITRVQKKPLPPDFFEKFFKLEPEVQVKYKKYLEAKGYDTEGL